MAERILMGQPASRGLAAGHMARLPAAQASARVRRPLADPEAEHGALYAAIARAMNQLDGLIENADDHGSAILAFQRVLLDDDELRKPVFAAIRSGAAAQDAWCAEMGQQIALYRASPNEYFNARAADIEDLRERVLACLHAEAALPEHALPAEGIVVGEDLSPSRFLSIDWSGGRAIVLTEGSATSHVAMLARARGVPMIVGLDGEIPHGARELLVDAIDGRVVVDPTEEDRARFLLRMEDDAAQRIAAQRCAWRPAMTRDGTPIALNVNVASLAELDSLDANTCDGIGLVRTELLFEDSAALRAEDVQYRAYHRLLDWAQGRPVIVRTLDAGGDKPIADVTIDGESNPFLGVRGIRLSLARPELFRVQLRALARAAVHGNLKVMLPMVSVPGEIDTVRAMFAAEVDALRGGGLDAAVPPLGIMVEVPAVAIAPESFDADFMSIGTNDLTQYTLAAGRDNAAVASLADAENPAVLRLVEHVVRHGRSSGIGISVCGDAASDPNALPALLAAGVRAISIGIASVARIKAAVAGLTLDTTSTTP